MPITFSMSGASASGMVTVLRFICTRTRAGQHSVRRDGKTEVRRAHLGGQEHRCFLERRVHLHEHGVLRTRRPWRK